jgi:flagellar basal-body rod modification protein FlgD
MTTINTALSPTSAAPPKSTAAAGGTLGKDDFLRLLITQLRYQDPLNPLDQNQFMTQTAQFSSLEALQNIDHGLSSLQTTMNGSALTQAAGLLGRTALASGADFSYDGANGTLTFAVDTDASSVTVQVLDASGTVIRTLATGPVSAGGHSVTWDGADSAGAPMSAGTYHYRVSAQGGARAAAAAGTIDGLHADGGQLTYLIGDVTVRQDDLIDVR